MHGCIIDSNDWRQTFAMSRQEMRRWLRALAQPTTYLGVAMLVFIFAALSYLLYQARASDEEDAKRSGENLTRMYAQSISRLLASADNTLLLLREYYRNNPTETNFITWATGPQFKNDLGFQYWLIGRDGIVKASSSKASSSKSAAVGLDISDLPHFKVHATATDDKLFVSKPVWLRARGQWGLILTRRLSAADGTFAGVLSASFELRQLAKLSTDLELGAGGNIWLVDFDGMIYSRATMAGVQPEWIGQRVPRASVIPRATRSPFGAYWNETNTIDGMKRLVSYRVVEGYPLIAAVGTSQTAVYRQGTEAAHIYLAVAALLTLAILGAITVGAVREKRLIAAKEESGTRQSLVRHRAR